MSKDKFKEENLQESGSGGSAADNDIDALLSKKFISQSEADLLRRSDLFSVCTDLVKPALESGMEYWAVVKHLQGEKLPITLAGRIVKVCWEETRNAKKEKKRKRKN